MAKKENNITKQIMLAVSRHCRLFRNNTGCVTDKDGRFHRFGLMKGSADLIGITPVKITEDMVGSTLGVFTSIEVKTPTGRVREEQENWMKQIQSLGGYAGIARSAEDAVDIVHNAPVRDNLFS